MRLLAVAVGPKSSNPKYQQVLEGIAGDDVYHASNYDNLDALFDGLAKVICRKLFYVPCDPGTTEPEPLCFQEGVFFITPYYFESKIWKLLLFVDA